MASPDPRPFTGSLQGRLLRRLLGLLVLVWAVVVVATWFDVRHELDELLDSHLAQAAAALAVQPLASAHTPAIAPLLHKEARRTAHQVWLDGRLVLRSANAGELPLSQHPEGFAQVTGPDGRHWRVFVATSTHDGRRVLVGEQQTARRDILRAVLRSLLIPMLLAFPALALLMWWTVRRSLWPLRELSRVLAGRSPMDASPVQLDCPPREMQPVVRALNDLLNRIQTLLETERRFTADASHELRTPLAALKAQAQVALRAQDDPEVSATALRAVLLATERASRLVDQLLTLARLDHGSGNLPDLPVDLATLAQEVAADAAPAAMDRRQSLALDLLPPTHSDWTVWGDATLLRVLLRNLLDNALRYSPDGAEVALRLEHRPQAGPELSVEDSGQGLSDADLARLGERFFRVLGSGQSGSGLGWSIVRRIAQVQGLQLVADRSPELAGLRVRVRWPNGPLTS